MKIKKRLIYRIAYVFCWLAFHTAFNIKYEGKYKLPKDHTYIVAPNHRTYIDPPVLATVIHEPMSYVAKKELFEKKGFFSWLIKTLSAFPSTSDDPNYDVIEKSKNELDDRGRLLCIFPEGTRHRDGKVGRGHSGVVLIAAKAGVPVMPTALIYGDKLHFRSKITVKFGKMRYPEDYGCDENSTTKDLKPMRDDIMKDIKRMLGQLQPEEDDIKGYLL